MSIWQLALPSLLYVGLLFYIAWRVENKAGSAFRLPALTYALSLAVYCTSWTFYGAVERAAFNGWDFLPIYLGPALLFIFGHKLLERLVLVSKRNNITSISDFLSTRYGKSQAIAVCVTLIATVGVVPYIALQLKALAKAFEVVTGSNNLHFPATNFSLDSAFVITCSMAFFAIAFGTRKIDRSEHHPGIVHAVAFESLVKLIAFIAVGLFCLWGIFGSSQSMQQAWQASAQNNPFGHLDLSFNFVTQLLLAFLAMLCLPRQFHVTVVENTNPKHLKTARWVLPIYLLIISCLVVPITSAGLLTLPSNIAPDSYLLTLPMQQQLNGLTLLALIGGFSAATGMIIVSSVALSTMISNDIVMPSLLFLERHGLKLTGNRHQQLLIVRRACIIAALLGAYAYYQALTANHSLASIGLLSFAAISQFAPGLLLGLFSSNITAKAVLTGLCVGAFFWAYTLLLPVLVNAGWAPSYLTDHDWLLHPQALFGLSGLDPLTHGVAWSLGSNLLCTWLISQLSSRRVIERLQANAFIDDIAPPQTGKPSMTGQISVGDLSALVQQFWGAETSPPRLTAAKVKQPQRANEKAHHSLVEAAEADLASAIGNATARVLLRSALSGRDVHIGDVATLVGETTSALEFSREVLQATLDNIEQAVSVIDSDLKLVAWNQQYQALFDYPDTLMHVGTPVEALIRHNAERGECGPGEIDQHIAKRLAHYRAGHGHSFERQRQNGQVLQMRGNPMPGGGFVTSFTDVTEYKRTQAELEAINANLEERVSTRTKAVESAREEAERANLSKTRFLAAASHDLLQPLNAARLFAAASHNEQDLQQLQDNLKRIDQSLTSAESLLSALLDTSKLDTNAWPHQPEHFDLNNILESLANEFGVIAADKGITLNVRPTTLCCYADPTLTRRAIQNLMANAIRYTDAGHVLVAARKRGSTIHLQVWDTGIGMKQQDLPHIFEEFQRLGSKQDSSGLGLGLSIVERICRLCGHQIEVESKLGQGTRFSLIVPLSHKKPSHQPGNFSNPQTAQPKSLRILCIDNEPAVLAGMQTLLKNWGYEVYVANDINTASQQPVCDVLLADYQLDHQETGLQAATTIAQSWNKMPITAIITANHSDELKAQIKAKGYHFFHKPLKPAMLRAWLNAMSQQL